MFSVAMMHRLGEYRMHFVTPIGQTLWLRGGTVATHSGKAHKTPQACREACVQSAALGWQVGGLRCDMAVPDDVEALEGFVRGELGTVNIWWACSSLQHHWSICTTVPCRKHM